MSFECTLTRCIDVLPEPACGRELPLEDNKLSMLFSCAYWEIYLSLWTFIFPSL